MHNGSIMVANSDTQEVRWHPPVMDESEVADYIRVNVRTLRQWRIRKPPTGPPFFRAGKLVRYRKDALDAWMEAQTVTTTDRKRRAG